MTPMQKLKNQFDEFKSLLPSGFTEISLNHSEEKTYTSMFCGDAETFENKGVKSDFIKLFQIKFNNQDAFSIGFSFDYLKDNESVQVSIKEGTKYPIYFLSKPFAIDEFRDSFKHVISQIKSSECDYEKILTIFKDEYDLKPKNHKRTKAEKRQIRKSI